MKKLITLLLFTVALIAQNPQTINMSAPPPPAPTNVSATVVNGANSTYYYWIVASYPIGKVITNSPTVVFRGPTTYSVSSHVNIGWSGQTGATTYDVLRTTTPSTPSGTTTSSVATALTVTSFDDNVASPSSYTLSPVAGTVNGAISIDNTNNNAPLIKWSLPTVDVFPYRFLAGSARTISAGVNQLPAASSANLYYVAVVNDATVFCNATGGGSAISVLMSNGTAWVSICGSGGGGSGTVTSVGIGSTDLSVSGSPITTSGTITLNLNVTAVTAGTYGDSTHVGRFTVDAKGRLTAASSVAISGSGGALGCAVSSTSATSTLSTPCIYNVGSVTYTLGSSATAVLSGTVTSGDVIWYIGFDGVLYASEGSTATLTCTNCTSATNALFPIYSQPIATATFVNNVYTADTDLRGSVRSMVYTPGTNLTASAIPEGSIQLDTGPDVSLYSINQSGVPIYCADSGSANAITCNLTPALNGYTAGMQIWVKRNATNTGATTIAINGLTATAIRLMDGSTVLYPGALVTGQFYQLTYDGTLFRLGNQLHLGVCDIPIGNTAGSAIANGDLGPQSRVCFLPSAGTVIEVDVNADAGTPNVIIGRNHAGTIANILSAALATAGSGGIACSRPTAVTGINGATTCSATLQNTTFAAGDYFELVSGTAGGTAKFMVAHVIYLLNN